MKLADATTRVSFKNILFATDFSIHSSAALAYGMAIARRYGSTMHAVHVVSPFSYQGVPAEFSGVSYEEVMRAADAQMRETERRLTAVPHTRTISEGEIWPVLSEVIDRENIDLMIMGSRGRTGVSRMLMGSVAEQIYRQALCPVLTVGPNASFVVPHKIELKRIIFATDFSLHSLAAAPYAFSLAQEHDACLVMLHVVHDKPREAGFEVEKESQVRERLLQLVPENADAWCRPVAEIGHGAPGEEIVAIASEIKANLIVLGVRKTEHPALMPHVPGSVSRVLISEAHCPVLTVRGR